MKKQQDILLFGQLSAECHRFDVFSILVSPTAQKAFDSITWNFQRTESSGIFDYGALSITEKVNGLRTFTIFTLHNVCAVHRGIS